MNPSVAKNALVFLSRVELKGNEALALAEVQQAIAVFANTEPVSQEKKPAKKED